MTISKKISHLLILLILRSVINQVAAQEKAEVFTAKNVVYAELLGNAGLYAVNYGRIFYQKERL